MNYLMGLLFIAGGIICLVFRQKIGVAFCRWGKNSWRNSPFGLSKAIESTYDEKWAPWFFCLVGIVMVAFGLLILIANG